MLAGIAARSLGGTAMLDWEENLFLGLKALYRGAFVRPEEKRRATVRVTLQAQRQSLLLLAEMLAGRSLSIFETPNPVLCGGDRIFLPAEFSMANTRVANTCFYELKTILAALALREGWHQNGMPLSGLVTRCHDEFPHLGEKLETLRCGLGLDADLWLTLGQLPHGGKAIASAQLAGVPAAPESKSSDSITTEIQGKGQANVEVLPLKDDDGTGADLPMHTFEKVETIEEYSGQSRKSDGEDELQEHEEALRDVNMTKVVRSHERPRSIYRSDIILDGLGLEVGDDKPGAGLAYPEWDYRKPEYRRDWCFLQTEAITDAKPDWPKQTEVKHRSLIRRLQRQFATMVSDWLHLRRQPAGSEFDIDAVVEAEVERRTGHTPTEAIYLDRRRDLHDIAALILMDESYSTDAWMNNRRVLDIITETVFCVGEVLEDYVEKFALASFSSNTRRSCRFNVVKNFQEPWATVAGRLGSLQPRGYTRIGPALRHAQDQLLNERAARKIVILITDGRPCDYDRYEGIYGIKDVKKAIEVGKQNGIQTHAFAVEKQAAECFPQMFTQHHYDILQSPDRLAQTMCKLFAKLLAK